jgi:hypothetical protein
MISRWRKLPNFSLALCQSLARTSQGRQSESTAVDSDDQQTCDFDDLRAWWKRGLAQGKTESPSSGFDRFLSDTRRSRLPILSRRDRTPGTKSVTLLRVQRAQASIRVNAKHRRAESFLSCTSHVSAAR